MRFVPTFAAIAFCLLGMSGCRPIWPEMTDGELNLPAARMSPDSVVVEVAFVYVPLDGDEDQIKEIWSEVDEQVLLSETRRSLNENGLRAGLIGSQLPGTLQQLLEAQQERAEEVQQMPSGEGDEVATQQRRIHSRAGHRAEIVTTGDQEEAVVLMNDDGKVRGERYANAQSIFSLRTFPKGDGSVEFELTPEVHYGVAKMRWVGFEGSFKTEVSREREPFPKQRIKATLSPGQTFIVSGDDTGLGKLFFSDTSTEGNERRVLLLRLAQTQHDDLFAPDQLQTPLETPAD